MAKKLSLFIEDNNFRVLLCDNERVIKWANLPLETGLIANGVVTDEEKLATLIRQQFSFLQVGQKWAVLGLSGLNSLYRIISLPQMPDNLVGEAVRHEAERVMPIAVSDVYLSYQVIPGGKPEEKRIFLAAFPKLAADSMIRTIRRAGLEPYMLDLAPLALARTVSQPRAVAVNSRGSNLDIVVVSEKIPQVLRSLPLPSEAESITEKLAAIAEEVERTIAFYNQSQQDNPLDEQAPVLVTGDLAQMKESWDLLATRLGHPVKPIPSPLQEPSGFDAAQFMVNIGLILKESPREKGPDAALLVNFNALPNTYHKRQISLVNITVPVVAIIALTVLVVMGYLTMGVSSHVATLEGEIASVDKQITATQVEINALKAKIKQFQDQVKPLEEKTAILNAKISEFKTSRKNADELTYKIVDLLPDSVTLTQVNQAVNTIVVTGNDEKLQNIFDYARLIRNTNLFGVVITEIRETTAGEEDSVTTIYEFNFSLTIR